MARAPLRVLLLLLLAPILESVLGFAFWGYVCAMWHVHCNRFAKCLFKKFDWILHLMHCAAPCCCCRCCCIIVVLYAALWLV